MINQDDLSKIYSLSCDRRDENRQKARNIRRVEIGLKIPSLFFSSLGTSLTALDLIYKSFAIKTFALIAIFLSTASQSILTFLDPRDRSDSFNKNAEKYENIVLFINKQRNINYKRKADFFIFLEDSTEPIIIKSKQEYDARIIQHVTQLLSEIEDQ